MMAARHCGGGAHAALIFSAALAFQDVSPPEDLFVTVGLDSAVLREIRHAEFAAGTSAAKVFDLPPELQPETVALRVLSGPGQLRILEQAATFPVLDRQHIVETLVGTTVTLRHYYGDQEETVEGKLAIDPYVQGPDGPITLPLYVETPQGQVRILQDPEIQLDALPEGPWHRMRLDWVLDSTAAGRYRLELSYATHGLWAEPLYALRIDSDQRADVMGFATVHNETGRTLREVTLQLALPSVGVPGTGHRVPWPVTLAAGESRRVSVVQWLGLAVETHLTAVLPSSRKTARVTARRRLDLRSPRGGEGRLWPMEAPVQIVRLDAQNLPSLPIPGELLPPVASDAVSLLAEPVEAVRVERRGVSVEDRWRGVVHVLNDGDDAVEVDVFEPLAPGEVLVSSSTPATVLEGRARFTVSVAKRAAAEVAYELGEAAGAGPD